MNFITETPLESQRMRPSLFLIISGMILFLYFGVQLQHWFLRFTHGYLIKVWLPPFILFWYLIIKKLMTGTFGLKINLKMDPTLVFSLLAYSFFGFLAMALSESPYSTVKYSLIILNPVILFILITEHFRDNEDIKRFLKVFFFCGILQALYSFLRVRIWLAAGMPALDEIVTNKGFVAGGDAHAEYWSPILGEKLIRLGDPSFEQGEFGAIIAPLAFLGALYGLESTRWWRYLYFGISLFILTLIVDTMSRSAILAVILGLFVFFHFVSRYRYGMNKKKTFLLLLLPLGLSFFFGIKVWLRLLESLTTIEWLSDFSIISDLAESHVNLHFLKQDPHIISLENTLSTFIGSPFLGVGYTNFHGSFYEDTLGGQYPELNRYLIILGTSGLFTLIPYVFFIFSLIWVNYRTVLTLYERGHPELMLGIVFLACNGMFTVKLINSGEEYLYYWVFFALSAAWVRNCAARPTENLIGKSK